jgi:hypothetical protein
LVQEYRAGGARRVPNPTLAKPVGHGNTLDRGTLPRGLSMVQFRYEDRTALPIQISDKLFIAGFVGIAQSRESNALRPHVGWAVRDAN